MRRQLPRLPSEPMAIQPLEQAARRAAEEEEHIERAQFYNDMLLETNLQRVDIDTCFFKGCKFPECIIQKSYITDAVFRDCDLSNVHFEDTNFRRVEFHNCKLVGTNFTCSHCSGRVEKALNAVEGVKATVDLEAKTAYLDLDREVSDEALTQAVTEAGYEVKRIR